jgi:hypothetical protein
MIKLMSDISVREHVQVMTQDHPAAQAGAQGMSILNVGYGLGIVSTHAAVSNQPVA